MTISPGPPSIVSSPDQPLYLRYRWRHCSSCAEDWRRLAPGYRADVIDLDGLRLRRPEVHHGLPGGGGGLRLSQRAEGYWRTFVRGVETYAHGIDTGELPGQLIRGPQAAPA